jgi:hypothetical protein
MQHGEKEDNRLSLVSPVGESFVVEETDMY